MSRRLNNLDGTFGGVVVAAVSSKYLTNFYESLQLPKRTKMLLFYEKNKKLLLGELDDPRDLELVRKALDKEDAGDKRHALLETTGADGDTRLIGYTNYPNLNISIAVALHGDDIFAQWWAERQKDFLLLTGFVLFVVLLGGFAMNTLRQVRRVERSEKTAVMASQAKSDFLANMSHELRTPLNAIIGFSEMLDSGYFGTLNNKQKERVHDIHMCGTHLLELINDILEFSKGAAGKLELKEEKMNIGALVAECKRFFTERAQRHKVDLVDIVPRDLPRIIADQRKIKQVLMSQICP
jgi:signal transduction histidine kinase